MYMYITGTNLLIILTGNHTYASVKGREEYSFLKACFKPVWEEVGEVIANPVIDIGGKEYHMNIVFGSDYKVAYTCTCTYTIQFPSMWALIRIHIVVGIHVTHCCALLRSF